MSTIENTPMEIGSKESAIPAVETPLRRFARDFVSSRIAAAGAVLLALLILAAVFAPVLAPQNPYDLSQIDIMDSRLAPGELAMDGETRYLLGTDEQGRDMLSAILYGLRISILVGVSSTVIALAIGLTLGLLVGKIIIALVAVQWAYYARTARSAALVERGREYIEAATGLGLSPLRIVFRHLLPNCLPPLIVIAALQVASAISLEATLSFLGLGLPVTEPSLGLLIANGFDYMMSGRYWISLFPGLMLLLTVVAINLVADQLRDVLNPRLQTQ